MAFSIITELAWTGLNYSISHAGMAPAVQLAASAGPQKA